MARVALGRQRLELAGGAALVARVAIDRRVRAGQRKPIVMLFNLLNGDLPSPNGMALFAVGAKLPLVDVGVAILATLPNVAEHHLDVTLSTGNGSVHPPQGILCVTMIELGNGANRFPRTCGVAVLARNIETPMWTVRTTRSLRRSACQ